MERNVIFALDTLDRKKAIRYARKIAEMQRIPDNVQTSELEKVSKSLFAIKIGVLNIIDSGLSIIREIKQITKMDIICDLKLADIPDIAVIVAKKAMDAGADYLVIQSFVGEKTVEMVVSGEPSLKIILVSEMTHNDGGFTHEHLEDFARLAKKMNVWGIIGPGNRKDVQGKMDRIEKIRGIVGNQMKIIAAGVAEDQGGDEDSAVKAGADLLIKGRSIMRKLDKEIGSTIFDFDRRKMMWNVILPAVIFLLVGVSLAFILPSLSLGDLGEKIFIAVVFAIVGIILFNVIRRY